MSSVSPVQLTGSQNTNSYKTSTEKSNKNPFKTGAAIGAGVGSALFGLTSAGMRLGKAGVAANTAYGAGIGALIGLGAGALVLVGKILLREANKEDSTEQNTANTETKTIDKEA